MFGFWLRKLFRQFRTVHVRMNANCQVINCGTTKVRRADENRKEDTTKRHSIWTKRMTIWWGTHNTVSALTFDQPNGIHSTSITTNARRYFRSSELFGCCVVVVIGCVTTSHIHVYQTLGVSLNFALYWLYFSFAVKRSRLGRRIGVRAYIWINRLRSDPLISFNLYLTYFVISVLFGSHLSRIRPIQIIWISLPVPYACVYRYSIFIHTLHLRLWFSAFSFRFLSEHALQNSNSGLTFDNLDTSRTWQSHILLASLTHNNPHTHTFGAVSVWFLLSLFAFHWHF